MQIFTPHYLKILVLLTVTTLAIQQATAEEWTPPDSLDSLPIIKELPDLFTFADCGK